MRIAFWLVLAALPLIEIGLLIKVGGWIGFWPTLAIVVVTAFGGLAIMMQNGVTAALRVQQAMLEGEAPLLAMLEAAMVVMAGVLLITPGLLADALGLLLLVPPLRRLAARFVGRWLLLLDPSAVRPDPTGDRRFGERRGMGGGFERPGGEPRPPENGGAGPVIDGEFTRLGERTVDPDRRRPDDQR